MQDPGQYKLGTYDVKRTASFSFVQENPAIWGGHMPPLYNEFWANVGK